MVAAAHTAAEVRTLCLQSLQLHHKVAAAYLRVPLAHLMMPGMEALKL